MISTLEELPKPTPMPNLITYLEEREKCLMQDPMKMANYQKYKASTRTSVIDYLPIKLDIENVSRCNFRCVMCQVSEWKKGKRAEDLSYQDFKSIIDDQYGLVEIKLQGMGEPLLGKDNLFKMISYAREKHIWVRIATNASLLHLNNNYIKLIDSNVNEVQISFDAPNEELFAKIRPGSKFNRIIENCKLINRYCRDKNIRRTKMWCVVQNDNVRYLHEILDKANEMGFSSLVFSLDLGSWGSERWDNKITKFTVSKENSLDITLANSLVEKGKEYNMDVAFWDVTEKFDTESLSTLCPWPFERAYISSDLRVVPCCMIGNPDTYEIGEISEQTLSHVWSSADYNIFRENHITNKLPEVCRNCYL